MNTSFGSDFLNEFRIEQLAAYLKYLGWERAFELGSNASIWRNGNHPDEEVLVPNSMELRDSNRRILEVVDLLSNLLEKSAQEVFDEIGAMAADVINIRVVHSDVEGGTIPLHDGVLLFENARDLITAAARSTIEKKKHFSGRMSEYLSSFLAGIKFGQTARGSYIVSVISPLLVSENEQAIIENQSLTRAISNNLSIGLNALNEATDDSGDQTRSELFESLVDYGVSANLCDALIGLSGSEKKRNVDIDISLGKSESTEFDVELKFTFSSLDVPFLEEASNYYKEISEISNQTISGYVTKLHHEENEGFGEITIGAMVNGFTKAVTIQLNAEEYWEAHAAHKSGMIVECRGDLLISPRSAKLIEVKNFRVFGTGDLLEE